MFAVNVGIPLPLKLTLHEKPVGQNERMEQIILKRFSDPKVFFFSRLA